MVSHDLPDILFSISLPNYSETNLLGLIQDLCEENENAYVQVFLQFIVDCAELDVNVSTETCFSSVAIRSGPEPERFLGYRDPHLGLAIDDFLRGYLATDLPFTIPCWTRKVLELLRALRAAGGQSAVCALYFVVRLLIGGHCTLSNGLAQQSGTVFEGCQQLWGLYDYDLLNGDNFTDVTQKLNYLFQFYWESILGCNDSGNIRHLTTLLLRNHTQLRKDVLRTLREILSSNTTPVQETVVTELATMRDTLIAMCHREPQTVALPALSLIVDHPDVFAANVVDREKVFLLMTKPNLKLQQLARLFFINSIPEGTPRNFLEALERLLLNYQDAYDNLDRIVEVLLDSFPSLVEMYLYIVQRQSRAISRVSTTYLRLVVQGSANSETETGCLTDVATLTGEALHQLASDGEWCIYQDLLVNFQCVPNQVLQRIPESTLRDVSAHLLNTVRGVERPDNDCMNMCVTTWLRINALVCDKSELGDTLALLGTDWVLIGFLLEEWPEVDFTKLGDLADIVRECLKEPQDGDLMDVINLRHLIILKDSHKSVVLKDTIKLLELVEDRYFGIPDEVVCPSTTTKLNRVVAQLLMNSLRVQDIANRCQMDFFVRFNSRFLAWNTCIVRRTPKCIEGQSYVVCLLEFIDVWMPDNSIIGEYLSAMLQSPETRTLVPQICSAITGNTPSASAAKSTRMTAVVANALQAIDGRSNVAIASKRLLESISHQLSSSAPGDAIELVKILVEYLSRVRDQLQLANRHIQIVVHRFKSLDAIADRLVPEHISHGNRRLIFPIVGVILSLQPNDVERLTLHRILALLQ